MDGEQPPSGLCGGNCPLCVRIYVPDAQLPNVARSSPSLLVHLDQINYTAFYKITKKHDKTAKRVKQALDGVPLPSLKTDLMQAFMAKVDTQPFLRILNNEKYVAHLCV